MTARKPPLLLRSALTGRAYIVTAYTIGEGGIVAARTKYDVTDTFDALMPAAVAEAWVEGYADGRYDEQRGNPDRPCPHPAVQP